MREIPLTREGLVALVDDEDYPLASRFAWTPSLRRQTCYAYCAMRVGGRWTTRTMHRLLMRPDPGLVVDHINGNGLDNRRCNLRVCTQSQNVANQRAHVGTSSRYRGVSRLRNGRWQVGIYHDGRRRFIGNFEDEVDGALAYDLSALSVFGEFARPNFLEVHCA